MKAYSALPTGLASLACLTIFVGAQGCASKPQPALQPSQLYADVGSARVGGPMRLAADKPTQRTPPRLPIIKQTSLASANGENGSQPPPPPPPTLSSSATPMVVAPPPGETGGYYGDTPVQTSVLGGLFDSIFVPPAPPTPTTISTAKYREVQ